MTLKNGQKAPSFVLPDQNGKKHKLSDYRGQWVLLYFYPKDNTSGCTKEACTIRDNYSGFEKIKAKVLGISADSAASHRKFAEKHDLPFTLLADPEKKTIKAYGVWVKKNMTHLASSSSSTRKRDEKPGETRRMEKKYMGIARTSFLLNPAGEIVKIYENVKPPIHAQEVLADLNKLMN